MKSAVISTAERPARDLVARRVAQLGACACLALTVLGCSGGSGADLKAFCRDADKMNAAFDETFSGSDPLSISDYKAIAASLRKLASEAPKEIKSDLNLLAKSADEAVKTGSPIDSPAVTAADERTTDFVDRTCPADTTSD